MQSASMNVARTVIANLVRKHLVPSTRRGRLQLEVSMDEYGNFSGWIDPAWLERLRKRKRSRKKKL